MVFNRYNFDVNAVSSLEEFEEFQDAVTIQELEDLQDECPMPVIDLSSLGKKDKRCRLVVQVKQQGHLDTTNGYTKAEVILHLVM